MSDPPAGDDDTTDSGGVGDGRGDGGRSDGPPPTGDTDATQPNGGGPRGTVGDTGAGPRPEGTDESAGPPTAGARDTDPRPETPVEWVKWFFRTDHGAVVYLREMLSSVGLVVLVGLLLFGVSGLWPPMVAVESGSMNPHMERGDLVFVMEEHRLAAGAAYEDTGVVPHRTGERVGYRKFQLPGDVIVYQPDGNAATTPIIHRARFWVNESENWVANGKADPDHLGAADSCGELSQCPAPSSGFVTKGDANSRYDQVSGLSAPVQPAWVVGTAEFRIPWLGNIRLAWNAQTTVPPWVVEADPGPATGNATTATAAPAPPATPPAAPAPTTSTLTGQRAWT
jgi:signal peptidase